LKSGKKYFYKIRNIVIAFWNLSKISRKKYAANGNRIDGLSACTSLG